MTRSVLLVLWGVVAAGFLVAELASLRSACRLAALFVGWVGWHFFAR